MSDMFAPGTDVLLVADHLFEFAGPGSPMSKILEVGLRGQVKEWPPKDRFRVFEPLPYNHVVVDFMAAAGCQTYVPVEKLDFANPLEKLARI